MSQATLLPCQQCGFASPENARFCRSCGAALTAESEFTGAATRNYGRQDAPAPPMSAPLPSRPLAPSVVDAFGPDTKRQPYTPPAAMPSAAPPITNTNPLYAPPAQQYGYAPPPVPYGATTPERFGGFRRRSGVKWAAGALALGLAMAFGNVLKRNNTNNMRVSPDEIAMVRSMRGQENYRGKLTDTLTEVKGRSEREINELTRRIDRAREEARRAAERGASAGLGGVPLLDLDKFEYGQATVSNAIRIPGKEMRIQNVKEDFELLVRHYQDLMGKPVIYQYAEDDDDKKALFQTEGTPEQASVSVLIKQSDEFNGQWEILVLRSPFSFPRLGESKSGGLGMTQPESKIEVPGPAIAPLAPNGPNVKDVAVPKPPAKPRVP